LPCALTKDGKYVGQWGKKGAGDGEFNLVHDIVLDKRNRLTVGERTNQRVQIWIWPASSWASGSILVPVALTYVAPEDAVYMAHGLNMQVVKLNLHDGVFSAVRAKLQDNSTSRTESRWTQYRRLVRCRGREPAHPRIRETVIKTSADAVHLN
jgi:hypothetical protein